MNLRFDNGWRFVILQGREVEIGKIKKYLMGNPGKPSEPLVLYGEAGCGKTSLLAKAFSSVSDNVFLISLSWTSGDVYSGFHRQGWTPHLYPTMDSSDSGTPQITKSLQYVNNESIWGNGGTHFSTDTKVLKTRPSSDYCEQIECNRSQTNTGVMPSINNTPLTFPNSFKYNFETSDSGIQHVSHTWYMFASVACGWRTDRARIS